VKRGYRELIKRRKKEREKDREDVQWRLLFVHLGHWCFFHETGGRPDIMGPPILVLEGP
jgi:hypothetical protein